ncbi:uncharacterized protein [Watersipora subatra]|uniref:uncharacterized protein n=1 Tax=Watersipora subatra TaxID=2589382 RepID=UPI00355B59F7
MQHTQTFLLVTLFAATGVLAAPIQTSIFTHDLENKIDVEALRSFLEFCERNTDYCKEGGLMEQKLFKELFNRRMAWYQVYEMSSILRECLYQSETCDLQQTVTILNQMLTAAWESRGNAVQQQVFGSGIKALFNSDLARLNEPHVQAMYTRTGRRFGWRTKVLLPEMPKQLARAKRSNSNFLTSLLHGLEKVCGNRLCEETTSSTGGLGNA